jgi:hypothetical protein
VGQVDGRKATRNALGSPRNRVSAPARYYLAPKGQNAPTGRKTAFMPVSFVCLYHFGLKISASPEGGREGDLFSFSCHPFLRSLRLQVFRSKEDGLPNPPLNPSGKADLVRGLRRRAAYVGDAACAACSATEKGRFPTYHPKNDLF